MRKYALVLVAFLTPLLLSIPAYASDFNDGRGDSIGGGRDTSSIGTLISAMDDLVDVVEQVFLVILSNPFLVVLAAASLIVLGARIFKKVKRVAKG